MTLYLILGLILIIIGVLGLFTGKVLAGARGLKPNYYSKHENPKLHFIFIAFYILIGGFVVASSI